ncbi:MAG: zinc carboxypeptidase [Chitinophagaceae bacterium]|nr:MAG: zinc carboxypeptidase [Chitinophagaceae bacterium]
MNKHVLTGLLAIIVLSAQAQVPSPEEFLGYKIGTRYTPHYKVVNYFQAVAATAKANVLLESYGQTNEGRPLLLTYVSTSDNMQQLEKIRINNLRLAHLSNENAKSESAKQIAIVWLSYNVHGNETSSTEAAMLTLYSLVDPLNSKTKEWLKNTVVIIDPCINPDGRDRYVNWYNSVVGKQYNPALNSREHREPWPGGRTNHYNFDLNRDWAWQSQVESQQRIIKYNQWMPQVHVDFHEQGINNPYYFAPAAQPYHEVVTSWQKDFQVTLGKNHARYFDKNGWLYFTREVFDLFYPSYGDTYPTFNGAIGMTYEQAGGGSGGLGVLTDESDTLTLYNRAIHHYTTSLSTIEVSSLHANELINNFTTYFNDAVNNGSGEFKSFVVKYNDADRERINSLIALLTKNGIQFEINANDTKSNLSGYNYNTGKDESFSLKTGDVIIPSQQPRAAMTKVLFEPKSKLVDSATYDITAWSLPYVYGVNAFASKAKIQSNGTTNYTKASNKLADDYGYVIRWQGIQSAKVLSQLLLKSVKVRFSEQAFEIKGQQYDKGSLIVIKKGNEQFGTNLFSVVNEVCNENNITANNISTGFVDKGADFGSSKVHILKAPKIILLTGEGVNANAAGEIWHFFDQNLGYPITLVNANDFGRINFSETNVIIMPAGNYKFLNDKGSSDLLKEWINKGGRLVALENAVTQLAKLEWGIKIKKASEADDKKDTYDALQIFENREKDFLAGNIPGSIFKVELDNSHPLAFGYPNYYFTLKQDDNTFEFLKEGGWNVGVIKKDNQVAGFVGSKLSSKLKDAVVFGVQDMGAGAIVILGDDIIFRSFWENGKLMLCNSVFFVGQ